MAGEQLRLHDSIVVSGCKTAFELRTINQEHRRHYPSDIDAVFVLSGPGTYTDKLKPNQREIFRWMDRDRIRLGIAVAAEVTRTRLGLDQFSDPNIANREITKSEIRRFGPKIIYNGLPIENTVLQQSMTTRFSKLPQENLVLIEHVQGEDGEPHPIRHTGDQIKSLFDEIINPESPLYGLQTLAIVQHESDFGRTLHYFRKYNDDRERDGFSRIQLWPYAVQNRPQTFYPLLHAELVRLAPYHAKGDLGDSAEPFHT